MKLDDITGLSNRLAVAQKIARHAMFGAGLAHGNPFAPFRVHVLLVEVRRFEHVHVAVEGAESILGHGLALPTMSFRSIFSLLSAK